MLRTEIGGVLGFFCSHAYAHTYGEDRVRLSRSLKGVDMALYVVFRALGLKIDVLPIFENPENDRRANKSNFGGISAENVGWRWTVYPENGYDQDLDYDMDVKDDESDYVTRDPEATNLGDYKDVETRLQSILNSRKINGFMTTVDPVIVGTELHNAVIVDRGGDDHETQAEASPSSNQESRVSPITLNLYSSYT